MLNNNCTDVFFAKSRRAFVSLSSVDSSPAFCEIPNYELRYHATKQAIIQSLRIIRGQR